MNDTLIEIQSKNEVEIQNNDKNENRNKHCVICFEIVDENEEQFKFPCQHKKYMHTQCIITLDKCPLCRTASIYSVISHNDYIYTVFALICFSGILTLLSYTIWGQLLLSSGNGFYNNSTAMNDDNCTC